MSARPLAYWPSGGEVVAAPGCVIAAAEARRIEAQLLVAGSTEADGPLADLRRAIAAADRWRRAAAARYEPSWLATLAMNSSRELTLGRGPSGVGSPRNRQSGSQPSATS